MLVTNVKIRKAGEHEAEVVSALALRSKAHWGYPSAFIEACRAELTYVPNDLRQHAFYVLETDGTVVGFYALLPRAAHEVELEALFVEPQHIGKGYGRMLIEHAKATSRRSGAKMMTVQSDPNAVRFYLAAGGKPTGKRPSGSMVGRDLPVFMIDLSTL
jgi:GNAT superfamily N-acetyltransferase